MIGLDTERLWKVTVIVENANHTEEEYNLDLSYSEDRSRLEEIIDEREDGQYITCYVGRLETEVDVDLLSEIANTFFYNFDTEQEGAFYAYLEDYGDCEIEKAYEISVNGEYSFVGDDVFKDFDNASYYFAELNDIPEHLRFYFDLEMFIDDMLNDYVYVDGYGYYFLN